MLVRLGCVYHGYSYTRGWVKVLCGWWKERHWVDEGVLWLWIVRYHGHMICESLIGWWVTVSLLFGPLIGHRFDSLIDQIICSFSEQVGCSLYCDLRDDPKTFKKVRICHHLMLAFMPHTFIFHTRRMGSQLWCKRLAWWKAPGQVSALTLSLTMHPNPPRLCHSLLVVPCCFISLFSFLSLGP